MAAKSIRQLLDDLGNAVDGVQDLLVIYGNMTPGDEYGALSVLVTDGLRRIVDDVHREVRPLLEAHFPEAT